jgi:hypothetical protein
MRLKIQLSRGSDSNRRVLADPDYKSGAVNHCATPANSFRKSILFLIQLYEVFSMLLHCIVKIPLYLFLVNHVKHMSIGSKCCMLDVCLLCIVALDLNICSIC